MTFTPEQAPDMVSIPRDDLVVLVKMALSWEDPQAGPWRLEDDEWDVVQRARAALGQDV